MLKNQTPPHPLRLSSTANSVDLKEYPAMQILALDLGNYKTVGCTYESESGAHQFQRTFTTPADLRRLVQEVRPDAVGVLIPRSRLKLRSAKNYGKLELQQLYNNF